MNSQEELPIGDTLNGTFGYDFEDKETRLQLELLDDVHKLGVSKYVDLPQLVVVGDQSTGKSSVLQAITEVPFPTGDEMCTRFATEIHLQRTNGPTTTTVSIIPDPDDYSERKKLLREWTPENFDPSAKLSKQAMKDLIKQAEKMIFGTGSPKRASPVPGKPLMASNSLSSSTLRVTRCGPKEKNFAIVDIPGLVRGGDHNPEAQTAKNLVEKYLKNTRSIIVVVIDIVDRKRQGIFELLKNLPNAESRVIGVINKCDTKQKKSDDWMYRADTMRVFNLIRNESTPQSKYHYKAGWYGLRNRQPSEETVSNQERDRLEEIFFAGEEWAALGAEKLGRHNLKRSLVRMRNQHVKESMPAILSEIQSRLDTCTTKLDKLGAPRSTAQAQYTMLNKIAVKFSAMANNALDGHYENLSDNKMFGRKRIRDDLDAFEAKMSSEGHSIPFMSPAEDASLLVGITDESQWPELFFRNRTYEWVRNTIKNFRAKEDSGEVNPEVKSHLWKDQTSSWEKIGAEAFEAVNRTVESLLNVLLCEACPDKTLRQKLRAWLANDLDAACEDAKQELRRLVANERAALVTLNPAKRDKQVTLQQQRIDGITDLLCSKQDGVVMRLTTDKPSSLQPVDANLVVKAVMRNNAELVGILSTHDNISAYYHIALYRFVDNFAIQVVERHLLGPRGPLKLFNSEYVTQKLYGDDNTVELNRLMEEDPEIALIRFELEREKVSLEESKKKVQNFRVL